MDIKTVATVFAVVVSTFAFYLSWRTHMLDTGRLYVTTWAYSGKKEENEYFEAGITNLGRRPVFLKSAYVDVGDLRYSLISDDERGKIKIGEGEIKYLRHVHTGENFEEFDTFLESVQALENMDSRLQQMAVIVEDTAGWTVEAEIDWKGVALLGDGIVGMAAPFVSNRRERLKAQFEWKLPHVFRSKFRKFLRR